jgi:hypothetical protein
LGGEIVASNHINLVKLCVGIDSLAHLESFRAEKRQHARETGAEDMTTHVTRMWPRRADEILQGGSLYWVIKGVIQARQQIVRFDERIGGDGIRRCAIIMSPEIIQTQSAIRRPFQGWRYLEQAAAPPDLYRKNKASDDLPIDMQIALAEIGLR